jgi:hypothetical protein
VHALSGRSGVLHLGVHEADRREAVEVLAARQRPGDAPHVGATLGPIGPLRWSSATTSEIPIRPPGPSTRNISARTLGLSVDRLITQLEITMFERLVHATGSAGRCAHATTALSGGGLVRTLGLP